MINFHIRIKLLATVFFLILFSIDTASADWARGVGEHIYGPDTAENIACDYAEQKAIKHALQVVAGERVKDEDLLICQEQFHTASCRLNKMTLSITDGIVRATKEKTREISRDKTGFRRCTITINADIIVAPGKPDPSFDFTVSLNQKAFRDGDTLRIGIKVNQPMFLNVFQWLPYEKKLPKVLRLFPNKLDLKNHFIHEETIPTAKNSKNYRLDVRFPNSLDADINYADEYLIVVGTRKPTLFKQTYSLEEFKERLIEIPRSERRHITKAYSILRLP